MRVGLVILLGMAPPGLGGGRERRDVTFLVNIEPREAVVHAALDVLVSADGEARDRDVGCGDAELPFASALCWGGGGGYSGVKWRKV